MSTPSLGSISFLDTPDVNGALVLTTSTGLTGAQLLGTSGVLTITPSGSNYVFTVADNATLGGTAGVTLPVGTTGNRAVTPPTGQLRFNSTLGATEFYNGSFWTTEGRVLQVVTGSIAANSTTAVVAPTSAAPTTAGALLFSTTFTPISSTSRVIVSFSVNAAPSTTVANGTGFTISVFSGSTPRGVSVARTQPVAGAFTMVPVQVSWSSGSTAAVAIAAYGVLHASGPTLYFNNYSTVYYAGAMVTQYTIMEVA